MLGNSSGGNALGNRTAVGIRSLTTVTPATTGQVAKKKTEGATERRVDGIDRDDEKARRFLAALAEDDEDGQKQEELDQPPGHGRSLHRFQDDAFRTDAKGKPVPPTFADVDQGNLGDAWLLAACAAVAHARPEALLERVRQRRDGSFDVFLGEARFKVAPEFPGEQYADPTPGGQRDTLWVALVEKAFATQAAGSYAHLEAGNPGRALEALTGVRARKLSLTARTSLEALWSELTAAEKRGRAMVLRTHEQQVKAPLHAEHAYAVVGLIERGGQRLLKVYNPWGTEGGQRPVEELLHELPLEAVRADFDAIWFA